MGRTETVGRRALLVAGAVTLAGCTTDGGGARPRKPSAAERAALAEAALRRRSASTSRTLLERYDAVLAAHPSLTARLSPLRTAVAAHTAALAEGAEAKAAPSADTAPSAGTRTADTVEGRAAGPSAQAPSAGASASSPPAPAVPADPAAALKELAAAVRSTADTHTATLLDAPPEYARLLASVAAAGAVHAYLLTEGGRG
ncbi:hypothetical protein M5362_13190 [Streptomyces sp. Je 1-79]|uniref:hypothetical protein n=1 Tax=Streptomyces sp. Je 1-79 TaxID=2943847 RepID=UPI0021A72EEB|nr:hypothetical protein [Streptomyces sp. Je 1-79]MCT4354086.1 hypothetical protein [Streptomyces sp. Je 1-79]